MENKSKKIIIILAAFCIIISVMYLVRGFKIRNLREEVHEKDQMLINKEYELKLYQIKNEDLEKILNEYQSRRVLDTLYNSIYNSYEKL